MNKEFFEAVALMEKEKGIPAEYLYEKISAAIITAVKKDYGGKDVISCEINPEKNEFDVCYCRTVVEEVEDPDAEISLEDAQQIKKKYKIGDTVKVKLTKKDFGRIAAQTAKHVIRQDRQSVV